MHFPGSVRNITTLHVSPISRATPCRWSHSSWDTDAWTGGHQGHSTPPVQTFPATVPTCIFPRCLPNASGCLDRGPPGPLNAPCPDFPSHRPHMHLSPLPSQRLRMPGQGATRATQRPLSRLSQSPSPHAARHKDRKVPKCSRGGSCTLRGGGHAHSTYNRRAPLFSAGENPCLKNPTYILAYITEGLVAGGGRD